MTECLPGARFGLSEMVKKSFRVQWNDPFDLSKGIKYLWLTDKEAEMLGPAVQTELVSVSQNGSRNVDDDDGDESLDDEVRSECPSLPACVSRDPARNALTGCR